MDLKPLLFGVLGVALVISVLSDLKYRRIFEFVTGPTVLVALSLRFWREQLGDVEHGLVSGLVGAGACAAIFGVVALLGRGRSLGWGDVALLTGVGAAFGYPLALAAMMFVALAGALQAMVIALWRGTLSDTLGRVVRREGKAAEGHLPYGVAIALGSVWTMWWDS